MDTAGQEKFQALNFQYFKKADGCLLVYDISDRESYNEIKNVYLEKIREICKEKIKVVLLGNKTDLEDERKVSSEEGAQLSADNVFIYMETSCLKNTNVADSFETLIELTYRDSLEENDKTEKLISINKSSNGKKKKGCCW